MSVGYEEHKPTVINGWTISQYGIKWQAVKKGLQGINSDSRTVVIAWARNN